MKIKKIVGLSLLLASSSVAFAGVSSVSDKYVLPQNISPCECAYNYNLSSETSSCYTINSDELNVYLSVKFGYSSNYIDQAGKKEISKVANFIHGNDVKDVTIKGFASRGETTPLQQAFNERLSHHRADAVANYIESLGVKPDAYSVKWFGYEYSLIPNDTAANKQVNQRVQVEITSELKTK